jgi:PAS domain S-box-containing protein
MSGQRRRKVESKGGPQTTQYDLGQPITDGEVPRRITDTLPGPQEPVLALSRTASEVQSLLDPDRVLETIGDELRDRGLACFFGLLDEKRNEVVLRYTNLSPETRQAVEAMAGVSMIGFSFAADALPHIKAAVQDGEKTFEKELVQHIREATVAPFKETACQLADFLGAHRAISVPLVAGSHILGVLTVWSEHLTEEAVPTVSVLAQQAAVGIERADLYEDAMQRVFEMEALRSTTLDMTGQLDLAQLLRLIVERAASLVKTSGGGLYLYRPEKDVLELVVSHNLGTDYTGTRLRPGEGLSGAVVLTGKPSAVEDFSNWDSRSGEYDGALLGGVVAVPLIYGDMTVGVLTLADTEGPRSFEKRDLWLLEWFANHAAVAIENARVFAEREHKIQQLAALHEVSLEISGETDPAQLLHTIVRRATLLLEAKAGAIDLFDAETQQLEMKHSHGYKRDYSDVKLSLGQGVAGRVCQTRQPLTVNDYRNWPHRAPQAAEDEISAALGVPLLRGPELLGVLTIDRSEPRPFDEEDVQLATLFANQAAIAIENAGLYREQERRSQELLALHDTSLYVASRLELHSLLSAIVARAVALLDGESGNMYLHRAATNDLISAASHNMPPQIEGAVVKPGEGVAGRILATQQSLIVDDYETWPGRSETYSGYGFARVVGVPITYGEQLLGVVAVERSSEKSRFTTRDQDLLTLLALHAAVAIENSTLFEETKRRAEELEGLHEVSTEIAKQLELPALLNTIVRRTIDLLDARAGGLYLSDSATGELELIFAQGHHTDRTGIRLALGEGVSGKVAQTGAPLVVRDYASWEGRSPNFEDEPTSSVLAVPLNQGTSLLGVFFVDASDPARVFDDSDVRLATLLANQAAIAIQNASLFGESERTIVQLEALQEVSLEVVSKTDLAEVLPTIVSVAARLLDAPGGAIYLYDREREQLDLTALHGHARAHIGTSLCPGEGVAGHVAQSREPIIVEDYSTWPAHSPQWGNESIGAVLGVPLMRANELRGVLTIDRPSARPFDASDLELATLFASQAAIAIENAATVATTRRRVTELTALREISLQLTQSLDLNTVLDTIVRSAVRLVNASDAHIFLHDSETQEFTFGSGEWAPGYEQHPYTRVRKNGLTATVARWGEPVVINEARSHPLFRDEPDEHNILEAIAGFPLKRANKMLGVFNVAFLEPHTFDQEDLRVLTLLADQAAIAIENARLYQETDRRLKESETLQDISGLVNSSLEPEEIMQTVVEKLASAFRYSVVTIYTNEGENLRLGAQAGDLALQVPDPLSSDKGIIARVAGSGKAEFVSDVTADPEYLPSVPGILSEIAVPILKDHEVLGVLNVESDAASLLTAADLSLLSSLAHQVSVAIQNAQLYQDAQRELAERRRAEQAYRGVVDHSLQGLVIMQDQKIVFANPAIEQILGYTIEELLAFTPDQIRDLVHPDDQKLVWGRQLDRLAGRRVAPRYECRAICKDGGMIWVELFANIQDYHGQPSTQAAVVDITERKRAQLELHESYSSLRNALKGTVNALAALAEIRDPYTAGHQERVSRLACAVAAEMGLPDDLIEGIHMVGLVHDIGKIHVPIEILSKPTELTEIETRMIRAHPQTGYDILCTVEFPWPVADMVLQHHERLDGSGYPQRLEEGEILLEARILAVADVVEAMASDRPYRPAHGLDEALAEISQYAGTLYDAGAVQACLTLFREKGFDLQLHED